MKSTEKEWKEFWELIDRIQGKRTSSVFRYAEVKIIADKALYLLENTETTERNAMVWQRVKDAWSDVEDDVHWGESDFRKTPDNTIQLKIDKLKDIVHTMWEFGFNDKQITDKVKPDFDLHPRLKQKWGDEPEAFTLANFPFSYGEETKQQIDKFEHDRFVFFSYFLKRTHPDMHRCFEFYVHEMNARRLRPADLAESLVKHLPEALAKGILTSRQALYILMNYIKFAYLYGHSGEGTYEADQLMANVYADLDAIDVLGGGEISFWPNDSKEEKERWTKIVNQRIKNLKEVEEK